VTAKDSSKCQRVKISKKNTSFNDISTAIWLTVRKLLMSDQFLNMGAFLIRRVLRPLREYGHITCRFVRKRHRGTYFGLRSRGEIAVGHEQRRSSRSNRFGKRSSGAGTSSSHNAHLLIWKCRISGKVRAL
jgi:hypothetical protein